jgi:hypothetical protein
MALRIPSPQSSGFNVGPAFIHVYRLMYFIGVALASRVQRSGCRRGSRVSWRPLP